MLPRYSELHCRSNFSFLTGASHPEELVERAAALGYGAIAITDECSLAGVVRAHVEAQAHKLPLIIGSEIRLSDAETGAPHARLVLLAQSRRGYGNLAHWITVARRRVEKGHYRAHPGDVEGKVPNAPMLAGLGGCFALLVPAAAQGQAEILAHATWLQAWFQDRAAIAVELLHRNDDDDLVDHVTEVAARTGLPVVAAGDVLMHVRSRKPLQDTLAATRLAKPVAECGLALAANAEQHLRSRSRLAALYEPAWLEQTMAIAESCEFSLADLKYEYPEEIVPPGETPASQLRKLAYQGATQRFPDGLPDEHRETIEHELAVIAELQYEAYFLTVADIVHWARDKGILCQGRGSAANSLVCYCLHVTEVDPRRASLLFGRFISVESKEPPDIDIDFEHQRREEVIQYIYGKYGRHRAALAAVVISYRPRSALRDVGRALGIDLQRIEAVSKSQHWFDGRGIAPERLRENGFDPESPVVRLWMELTGQLIGFPRHLSQHPGGFVIGKNRIEELVPIENAAMEDRSVIQWDKDDLESLGLLKVDILAIGMLSAIRRSLEYIGTKLGRAPLLMQEIGEGDVPTYDMICKADTVGVFQIESRAQMSMLPRLKPRCYYDLVVEVAIVRPGPIQGGMVHPYLNNRTLRDDEIDCPEELKPALLRTKGVPIFQEQVMQIAMLAADFTAGEADALRRAMAAWKRRGGLVAVPQAPGRPDGREGLHARIRRAHLQADPGLRRIRLPGKPRCRLRPARLRQQLDQVPSPRRLPVRPPQRPADGLLRAGAAGARRARARRRGAAGRRRGERMGKHDGGRGRAVQPVRLGLNRVKGLAEEAGRRIVAARAEAVFASVEDLARRARLDAHALAVLAGSGALQALTGHRHQAAWAVAGIDTRPTEMLRATRSNEAGVALAAPSEGEETHADYRALGLTLQRHPLALLRAQLAAFRIEPAARLRTFPNGRLARASGLVTHRQRPETAKGTVFVTLEDETGAVNVIVWPRVAEAQRKPLLGATLLTVYGQWQRQGEGDEAVMHLVAARMIDHTPLLQGLVTRSRDFR